MQAIRQISGLDKKIYLTFDDGPDPLMLPQILKILNRYNAKASFFMVAKKAEQHPGLTKEVLAQGHSIGNHSLDHTYSVFFSKSETLKKWILDSDDLLKKITGIQPVGFRPPNGICTPPLYQVLDDLRMPLILWNQRFYDTMFLWTKQKALRNLNKTKNGDIVLLHDSLRRTSFVEEHLKTLDFYLSAAKSENFQFAQLTNENCSYTI